MNYKLKAQFLFDKYLVLASDDKQFNRYRTSRESCKVVVNEILKELQDINNGFNCCILDRIKYWENVLDEILNYKPF